MIPDEAIAEAQAKRLRPIYLIVGEETHLVNTVFSALRGAALEGAIPGLNEDHFLAGERSVHEALTAARTLPMMSRKRLVIVQRLERWEPRNSSEGESRDEKERAAKDPFELLLDYVKNPSPTTTLLLVGGPVDKRRKLYVTARNEGWLVSCEPLGRAELPAFVNREAKRLGSALLPGVADLIAELTGPELGPVVDAVNRLSLYAGEQPISEEMVAECVVRIRTATVWELLAAVNRRDAGAALTALHEAFSPNEGIRLVGLLAWSARQLIRFESALRSGANPAEAAQQAGAPPFKARELSQQLKSAPRQVLEAWLLALMRVDRDLKGGSKLPPKAILERALLELCAVPVPT